MSLDASTWPVYTAFILIYFAGRLEKVGILMSIHSDLFAVIVNDIAFK